MKTLALTVAFLVALPLAAALAQEEGEKQPFDMEGAIRKVEELLKESERLLVESLKPERPSEEAAEKAEEAGRAIDDLLNESRKSGEEATDLMAEIVKNAPRRPGGGGGGEEHQQQPKDGEKEEPSDQSEVDEKDPKNSKDGEPESDQKKEGEPETGKKKPESKKDEPSDPDLEKEWLAGLPPEVRKDFENRNWDEIPPKWREIIRKYMKELADSESGD